MIVTHKDDLAILIFTSFAIDPNTQEQLKKERFPFRKLKTKVKNLSLLLFSKRLITKNQLIDISLFDGSVNINIEIKLNSVDMESSVCYN